MDRRSFFGGTAAFALTSAAGLLASRFLEADESAPGHTHHHGAASPPGPKETMLLHASSECSAAGDVCIQHCLDMLSEGDTSMAGCAKSVREMLVFCGALTNLAPTRSSHLKALAGITAQVCDDCEKECRKHAEMSICRTCADACASCSKACKSYIA